MEQEQVIVRGTVKFKITSDRNSDTRTFSVNVSIPEGPFDDHVEQRLRVAALRELVEFYESRIGSRYPLPEKRLIIEVVKVERESGE